MATPTAVPKVAPMQNLFKPVPEASQVPGMVTPASMVSPTGNTPLSGGGTTSTTITQGNTSSDWARAAAANNASQQRRYEEEETARRKAEAEAQLRAAYEKIYNPYLQSQWDISQGQIGGADPRRISGNPTNPGAAVYMKRGMGIGTGQSPYEYRPDTNMPTDQYNQALNQGFDMWKAMTMLGMGGGK